MKFSQVIILLAVATGAIALPSSIVKELKKREDCDATIDVIPAGCVKTSEACSFCCPTSVTPPSGCHFHLVSEDPLEYESCDLCGVLAGGYEMHCDAHQAR
ncbi:hypothetical protein ABW19_dt0204093 [Dactylella cylindrospora]|nr:hypothetical protein ABW19_dt0204093 [Dactylella cylindrospora]